MDQWIWLPKQGEKAIYFREETKSLQYDSPPEDITQNLALEHEYTY